ncbi:hypothetical protein JCM14036_31530 [Desulfotomaculum defluvii]
MKDQQIGPLQLTNEDFQTIFKKAAIGIVMTDTQGKVINSNPALQQMLGYSAEELINKSYKDITHADDLEACINLYQQILTGKCDSSEMIKRYIHKNGKIIWVRLVVSTIRNKFYLSMVEDITEHKMFEKQMEYLATHDYLTKIPNRYLLEKRLKTAIEKSKDGREVALLLLDVDNFTLVNDVLGHAGGDELLISLVSTLQCHLGQDDFIARLSGDEFALLLEGVDIKQVNEKAEKIRMSIEQEEICIVKQRVCYYLTVSIGVVVVDGTLDIKELLTHADIALRMAKERGKNRVVLISNNETEVANISRTTELVDIIRTGIRENRFILYFQPVLNNDEQQIVHHEVLLRLKDTQGQLLSPGEFIPIAEKFGLMPQIDRLVVESTIKILKSHPELKLFVNLSGVSLGDKKLLQTIEGEIFVSGINASHLGFEITETVAVKDFVQAGHWINRLRELGCPFALDDFGIGFSSFNYLRELPVDYIKIDGSYVRNIDQDPTQLAFVQAIQTVAKSLGKKTVAEFVENEQIINELKKLGVNYSQGYYIGKPFGEPQI